MKNLKMTRKDGKQFEIKKNYDGSFSIFTIGTWISCESCLSCFFPIPTFKSWVPAYQFLKENIEELI